jgi:hypothetical protein
MQGVAELEIEARQLSRFLPKTVPISYQQFVGHYTGKRKTRYQAAVNSLAERPVQVSDSYVSAFVKSEKLNPHAKINPTPRMIQARNARYNTEVGRYLRPMERSLYSLRRSKHGTRMIAKGLTLKERGTLLAEKMRCFRDPVVYSLDGKRWDTHCSSEILGVEHSVYLDICDDPFFRMLLSWQLHNVGFTQNGHRYTVKGGRMSGDMNTALGNCLLMIIMVFAFCAKVSLIRWDMLDDGDDCLLIIEKDEECKMATITDVFLSYGQELKLENRAEVMSDVVFCQGKPVMVDGVWQFIADWTKVLSTAACGTKYWATEGSRKGMFTAVGYCLLSLYRGIPILQAYACRLIELGDGCSINNDIYYSDLYRKVDKRVILEEVTPGDVHDCTRLSFMDAWHVDPQEQLDIEYKLAQWTPSDCLEDQADEIAVGWRLEYAPGCEPSDWENIPNNPSHVFENLSDL